MVADFGLHLRVVLLRSSEKQTCPRSPRRNKNEGIWAPKTSSCEAFALRKREENSDRLAPGAGRAPFCQDTDSMNSAGVEISE